ncbi:unnamed protein product, partial [Meganyctiphanes norvegica]
MQKIISLLWNQPHPHLVRDVVTCSLAVEAMSCSGRFQKRYIQRANYVADPEYQQTSIDAYHTHIRLLGLSITAFEVHDLITSSILRPHLEAIVACTELSCNVYAINSNHELRVVVSYGDRRGFPGSQRGVIWINLLGRTSFNKQLMIACRVMAESELHVRGFPRYVDLRASAFSSKFSMTSKLYMAAGRHHRFEHRVFWIWRSGYIYFLNDHALVWEEFVLKMNSLENKIHTSKVDVPSEETTYWCVVHKLPEEFVIKQHVLQYEPVIDQVNHDIVHHMEVFHCEYPTDFVMPAYQGPCHAADRAPEIDACKRVVAAWAMGALGIQYPKEAGLPLGGPDFNPYVMLEVHYNNPNLHKGRVDSSGVRFHYTGRLREHDVGIMELGLEYTPKMAIPPQMPSYVLSGYCVPSCTALGLPSMGIYMIASQLHTHLTGVRAWTKHYRSHQELPELNRDDHYSTHFQEIRMLPQPVHILPRYACYLVCMCAHVRRLLVTLHAIPSDIEIADIQYIHKSLGLHKEEYLFHKKAIGYCMFEKCKKFEKKIEM